MNKLDIKKVTFTLLSILSIPLTAYYVLGTAVEQPEVIANQSLVPLTSVTTQHLKTSDHHSSINGYGEVMPAETLLLISQVSGKAIWTSNNFKVGHHVKKGEILIKIEDSPYKVLVANAEKAVAEAHLALLQEERKHHRAGKEWLSSGISEKPSPLALRQPQLDIAKASYLAAKETLFDAKQTLSETKIYAPFDGIVSEQSVTKEGYIVSGSQLGQIKSTDMAEVLLALPEDDWRQLPSNLSELEITIRSKNTLEDTWSAKATSLSLLVDKKTRMRNLTLEISAPLEQEQALLLGSFVEVDIRGKVYPDSYIIASSSFTSDGYIWFIRNGVLARYKPNTLFHSIDHVGIEKGELEKSMSLVIKPLSHYITGMKVAETEVEVGHEVNHEKS